MVSYSEFYNHLMQTYPRHNFGAMGCEENRFKYFLLYWVRPELTNNKSADKSLNRLLEGTTFSQEDSESMIDVLKTQSVEKEGMIWSEIMVWMQYVEPMSKLRERMRIEFQKKETHVWLERYLNMEQFPELIKWYANGIYDIDTIRSFEANNVDVDIAVNLLKG